MPDSARLTTVLLSGLTGLALGTGDAWGLQGPDLILPSLERTGLLRSQSLDESSGLAVSRQYHGILWTHNDSGADAVIYAINLSGDLLGAYEIVGASSVDWEDIALGRCPDSALDCLYVADTGDNAERRDSVALYAFPEPEPPGRGGPRRILGARRLVLRYPDRPHDVESLAADPEGNLTLVTKGWKGGIIRFEVPREAWRRRTVTARTVDTLDIEPSFPLGRLATGAAISPSGARIVIRTYTELYFFTRTANNDLRSDGPPCWLGAIEPQGEAVDFIDETTVVLASESQRATPGPIYLATCPPVEDSS